MAMMRAKRVKPQRMITAHCWSVQVGSPATLLISALEAGAFDMVGPALARVLNWVVGE